MKIRHLFYTLALSAATASVAQAAPVTTIWVDNATSGAPILQDYDINTGALLQQFSAPHGFNGRGVVQVGNIVYYTSATSNGVFGYNFVTNTDLGTIFSVAGSSGLSTIAYDGTNFWIGDYSGTNHAYLYSATGTLLKTISLGNCTGFCDGLEFVNGNLISNRADEPNPGIYDMYDTNGNLIHSAFITDTHGNSTGIAWDGTFYYVDQVNSGGKIDEFNASGTFVKTLTLTGQTYFLGEDLSVNYSAVIPPSVPEPASLALLGVGVLGVGFVARRKRSV